MDFQPTISKEAIAELPLIFFEGEIVVVGTQQQADEVCKYLMRQQLIGFDTESRPVFQKGMVNRLALLQLSTETQAYLFRLDKIGLSKSILKVLENKQITKVGLSVTDDIRELEKLNKFSPLGFVDIQKITPGYGIEDMSLMKIAAIVLSGRISKSQRLSNWEAPRLSDAQKLYAATDAWVSLMIYKKLMGI